jgi:hypothetical protein
MSLGSYSSKLEQALPVLSCDSLVLSSSFLLLPPLLPPASLLPPLPLPHVLVKAAMLPFMN